MIDDMFGFLPNNVELYKLALIHRSASVVADGRSINNERLEFLGDAVIESVTSDYLFIEFPDYDEGQLTQLRSKLGFAAVAQRHCTRNRAGRVRYLQRFRKCVAEAYLRRWRSRR